MHLVEMHSGADPDPGPDPPGRLRCLLRRLAACDQRHHLVKSGQRLCELLDVRLGADDLRDDPREDECHH